MNYERKFLLTYLPDCNSGDPLITSGISGLEGVSEGVGRIGEIISVSGFIRPPRIPGRFVVVVGSSSPSSMMDSSK